MEKLNTCFALTETKLCSKKEIEPKIKEFKKKSYPRINRFDLDDAIKHNFIKVEECVKLIKDPNKHNILFQNIDDNSPSTKAVFDKQQINLEDITVKTYVQFIQTFVPLDNIIDKVTNAADVLNDQYLLKLIKLVGYLKHVTIKYYKLQKFFDEKNQISHGIYQYMNDIKMNPKGSLYDIGNKQQSAKQSEFLKQPSLNKIYSLDKKRFNLKLENHQRYIELARNEKQNLEKHILQLQDDIIKKNDKKDKSMRQRSRTVKDYFKKVQCYNDSHKLVLLQQKKKQKEYYKNLDSQKDNKDICAALFLQRKKDAINFLDQETKRLNHIKSLNDKKINNDNIHAQSTQEYFSNKNNEFRRTDTIKRAKQDNYVMKLTNNMNFLQENNNQNQVLLLQDHKNQVEKNYYEKNIKTNQLVQKNFKKKKEKLKQDKLIQKDYQFRIQENKKQLNTQFQTTQKQNRKMYNDDFKKKYDSHQIHLESIQQKLFTEQDKKQLSLQKNQESLKQKHETFYDKLDRKKQQIQQNNDKQLIQKKKILDNRLQLKQSMQKKMEESQQYLEDVNRNPLQYK